MTQSDQWIRKQDPARATRNTLHLQGHNYTKVKGCNKKFYSNRTHNQARVYKFLPNETDFNSKAIKKKRQKGHYIMITGSIQQEDIEVSKYIRQTVIDLQRRIDSNTIVVGTFILHPEKQTCHQNRTSTKSRVKSHPTSAGPNQPLQNLPSSNFWSKQYPKQIIHQDTKKSQ